MASSVPMATSTPEWDPFAQNFTLFLADQTPFNVSLADLNDFNLYNIRVCINWGSQLGASLLLLVVLLLLAKPERRRSPIFIINTFSLALNCVRCLLQCLYYTGAFNVTYTYFSGDYSRIATSDIAKSVTASVFYLLVLLCIQASFVLQTRVVCTTMAPLYQHCIAFVCGLAALLAVGFRFALTIVNSKSIVEGSDFFDWQWLASASLITITISICFFCVVFSGKLGVAIWQRRKLGLRQFGPMHIVFIMGCQTMIIPAIFAVLQYFTPAPELGQNVLTLVAIFLPLSSMWASANTKSRCTAPTTFPDSQRKLLHSCTTNCSTLVTDATSHAPISPARTDSTAGGELKDGISGVRVDRTFSMDSEKV
ncbi:MAG: hypothetical protein M1833_000747 [Piccolia ochrophora]|nr:MAG: hypothetical protein M1833_000747 [Piccolia ochrophora]